MAKKMKVPRGTMRANRRDEMHQFHADLCQRRDASYNHRIEGDAPGMEMPRYYRDHLSDGKRKAA